jgi:thioredoxin 1
MQELESANWEDIVLKSDKLTLVEFWAPWCPWCKRLIPLLKEIENEYEGKIVFTMLNTEDYPDIASKFGVWSLPTIKFFCKGQNVGDVIGYKPKEDLREELNKSLSKYSDCLSTSSKI